MDNGVVDFPALFEAYIRNEFRDDFHRVENVVAENGGDEGHDE
jgi:hypothetical protein